MCGIGGVVYPDPSKITYLLQPILETLNHRGNRALREAYSYKSTEVGITGGKMARSSIGVAAIDGFLDNSSALKETLEKRGYQLTDGSDAELVLFAYEAWGDEFLQHIEGSLAIFLLDTRSGELILVRDRIGKCSLYWFQSPQYFIFATELKAILATGAVPQTYSPDGLAHYLFLGYHPQDITPIKGVNKLLPGHYLKINADQSIKIKSYWSLSALCRKDLTDPKNILVQKFDALLTQKTCQQVPDAPFGCAISGGLGSASVAYYLQKCVSSDKYQAYSVAFQGENMDDMQAAETVSQSLHIQQHTDIITPSDFLKDFVKIVWYMDEPLADPNVIASWRLAGLVPANEVVFSGMGSDEFLAGHSRYTIAEREISYPEKLFQAVMPIMKKFILPFLHAFGSSQTFDILQRTRINPVQYEYLKKNAIFSQKELQAATPRIASLFDPHLYLHRLYKMSSIKSTIASLKYLDIKTKLVDSFILQYERAMSAHGLLWKSPFLTREMSEFLAQLPEPDRLTEEDTFFLLKTLLKDKFPSSFLYRPKRTRKDFLKQWVETGHLSRYFEMLPKGTLVEAGIVSEKWLKEQLKSVEQQQKSFRQLWSIFVLELWFRMYINNPMTSKAPEISIEELLS